VLKLRLTGDLDRSVREKDSTITLKADHTAVFTDVPEFDRFGDSIICRLSGSVNWKLDNEVSSGLSWSVVFEDYLPATESTLPECVYDGWSLYVLGRRAPHRLYVIVGDPDSDAGVEFGRVSH
jgi:hypothetical protein